MTFLAARKFPNPKTMREVTDTNCMSASSE